jgi:tetratricopeptide (TPR) repeat protein
MEAERGTPLFLGKSGEEQFSLLQDALAIGQGFELFFVCGNSPNILKEVVGRLQYSHISGDTHLDMFYEDPKDLARLLEHLLRAEKPPKGRNIITARSEGREAELRAGWTSGLVVLNEQRNRLIKACPSALLLMGPPHILLTAQSRAPDLWSVRASVFLFPDIAEGMSPFPARNVFRDMEPDALPHALKEGEYYQDLADALEGSGSKAERLSRARLLGSAARAWFLRGNPRDALLAFEKARAIYEDYGDLNGKAGILNGQARIYSMQGDIARAMVLWEESLRLEEQIGDVQGKAATLNNMAWVLAQQGDIARAMGLWEESLKLTEKIGDVQGKAATLHQMAGVLADQGDIARAMGLWEESLKLKEQIGDVQGKAATLHQMAGVLAQQGDIARAVCLWEESLKLNEQIGDVKGKAATLANMAWAEGKNGNRNKERDLNIQAARLLGACKAFFDLATVLGNLGAGGGEDAAAFLGQALWLGLRIPLPAENALLYSSTFIKKTGVAHRAALLCAAATLFFMQQRGKDTPKAAEYEKNAFALLRQCAKARNISPERLEIWMEEERLNDSSYVISEFKKELEKRIGDRWLFDPAGFPPL